VTPVAGTLLLMDQSPSMEIPQGSPNATEASLAELDAGVFENANTITKWLSSQSQGTRPQ
jgi:hypothetical protein